MRRKNNPKSDQIYRSRRKKLIKELGKSLAIFPSGTPPTLTRDQEYPFRYSSDFFYLTGLNIKNAILVLFGKKTPKSILYIHVANPEHAVWEGESMNIQQARRKLSIDDIRNVKEFEKDFSTHIDSCEDVHYSFGSSDTVDRLLHSLFSSPVLPQYNKPKSIIDSRELTSQMRLVKDRQEIQLLKRASEITARGLKEMAPVLSSMKNEKQCALQLESIFAKYGAQSTSFSTIIAAGKNATTLHHTPTFSPLWKKDLVLIDCGANFNGYAGDITRVFPVSGTFTEPQAEIYDAVHDAVQTGISHSILGSTLDDIHQAVVKSIVKSLLNLGILSGTSQKLISNGEYRKFFMHRTGHWLGLDVHDIGPADIGGIRAPSALIPLEPGMAFTIEPGLYFNHKDTSIPKRYCGIGIRLEEDILMTNKGAEIISSHIPISRTEIENMVAK